MMIVSEGPLLAHGGLSANRRGPKIAINDIRRPQINPADVKAQGPMTPSAGPSLSLRHLRRRHDDIGEEAFAAQRTRRRSTSRSIGSALFPSSAEDYDENVRTRCARSLTLN